MRSNALDFLVLARSRAWSARPKARSRPSTSPTSSTPKCAGGVVSSARSQPGSLRALPLGLVHEGAWTDDPAVTTAAGGSDGLSETLTPTRLGGSTLPRGSEGEVRRVAAALLLAAALLFFPLASSFAKRARRHPGPHRGGGHRKGRRGFRRPAAILACPLFFGGPP